MPKAGDGPAFRILGGALAKLNRRAPSADKAAQQHHHKDDQEDKEQNLRDSGSGERNPAKPEKACYHRDDKEYQSPVEHTLLS